jgi:GNAT superfamily N-acetyltransferase
LSLAQEAITDLHLATPASAGATGDEGALERFLADPQNHLLIATDQERVAGSLYGYRLPSPYRAEPQYLLYAIDVRPECTGKGIGTALVKRFIEEAREGGACEVWVLTSESNLAAMKMYARAGMVRRNKDDVMMEIGLR